MHTISPFANRLPAVLAHVIAACLFVMPVLKAEESAPRPGKGETIQFAGEVYHLKENKSAPGKPTSELREYLRKGETFENYAKMVAFRMQNTPANDAGQLAKAVLDQLKSKYPDALVKEYEITPKKAAVLFIIVDKSAVEYNLWRFFQADGGIASVQFVLRNKPPYETKAKFKAEQDANQKKWQAEMDDLMPEVTAILKATAR